MALDAVDPLAKLRAAIEEYLALGEDTPVAAEAQSLLAAIDTSGEPAAPVGPEGMLGGDMPPLPEGDVPLPDEGDVPPMEEPMAEVPDSPPKSFKEANRGAKEELERRNKKKAKA